MQRGTAVKLVRCEDNSSTVLFLISPLLVDSRVISAVLYEIGLLWILHTTTPSQLLITRTLRILNPLSFQNSGDIKKTTSTQCTSSIVSIPYHRGSACKIISRR